MSEGKGQWTIKGVPDPLRERIKAQCDRFDITIAEWMKVAADRMEGDAVIAPHEPDKPADNPAPKLAGLSELGNVLAGIAATAQLSKSPIPKALTSDAVKATRQAIRAAMGLPAIKPRASRKDKEQQPALPAPDNWRQIDGHTEPG